MFKAAFKLCQLTVNKASIRAPNPANTNTHQLTVVFKAKPSNHLPIKNQESGVAIKNAKPIHFIKSTFKILEDDNSWELFSIGITKSIYYPENMVTIYFEKVN